jgi:hypothetical protein
MRVAGQRGCAGHFGLPVWCGSSELGETDGGRCVCEPAPVGALTLANDSTTALIAAGAALGGTIIGGLITFGTAWFQTRDARAQRAAEAAAARRDRAAAILGRVRTFLTDIEPARIGINVNPETTPQTMEALALRRDTLREELSIFAAAAEDDRLMDRAGKLEVALFNVYHWVHWHAHDMLRHAGGLHSLHMAEWEHAKATVLVRIVHDLVRGRDVAEAEAALQRLEDAKPRDD